MSGFQQQSRSLTFADKLYLGGIITFSLAIKGCLYVAGFNRTAMLLRYGVTPFATENENSRHIVEGYHRLLILTSAVFPSDGMCLAISLTFWWLLQRKRIDTLLRIGIMKDGEELLSHAWIEYRGTPITVDPRIGDKYVQFDDVSMVITKRMS